MVKRVLMVAYHFPPMRGSSGIQRTLKFAQYLPKFGWQPLVLSAHPRAYARTGDDQMNEIAPDMPVERAFALDTSRHLAFRGKYLGGLALPDRWVSWWLGAVPAGLRMIRRHRPAAIWSTYPIATAHLIGYTLHKLTGLPWIADFRDPMTDDGYPPDPAMRRAYLWIEKKTLMHCTRAVFSTPGTIRDHLRRFPEIPPARFVLIENGYDEENFLSAVLAAPGQADAAKTPAGLAQAAAVHAPAAEAVLAGADADFAAGTPRHAAGTSSSLSPTSMPARPLLLVHSGIIYPSERDPVPMFEAIAALKQRGAISAQSLRILLRATAHDDYLRPLIERNDIADIVQLAPPVAYREALSEMLQADGLLILQAANCNSQIPAKLYEYLRAQRPILALTDAAGDTAQSLRGAGIDTIAALDSSTEIAAGLLRFLDLLQRGAAPVTPMAAVALRSREGRTQELAALLDSVTP